MGDIEEQLSRLAQGFDRIIMNRETLEHLLGEGMKLVEPPQLTLAESVEKLFERQREGALARAQKLPPVPSVDCPSISSLHYEIVQCIVFGMYGAAITLSSIMVEFALKYAIAEKECGGGGYDSAGWDKLENMTFGPTITAAAGVGLLTDDEARGLRAFKDEIRNPYNHYNLRKITKGGVWANVGVVDVRTGTVETRDIPVEENIVFQAQAKPLVDKQQVFAVFQSATEVVRRLLSRI